MSYAYPKPGSIWVDTNGKQYKIECITNTSARSSQYPITVVYVNTHNKTVWSRPLSDWHRSFKPL